MLNKIILIGRLTLDPEIRYTNNEGVAVANFTIAVDRPFTSSSGEKETDFVRIIAWKKQAENCANYLAKGRLVAVEGRLQIRSYEDREGIKRTIAEVVANSVVFLPDGKGKGGNDSAPQDGGYAGNDDDVPF